MDSAALRAIASWNVAIVSECRVNIYGKTDARKCGVASSRVGNAAVATNPQVLETMDERVGIGHRRFRVRSDTSSSL